MSAFFQAWQINPLLQTALIAGLLASIAGGIIGTYVVVKRIVFISGSIAHSVLGGMGFFLWLQRAQGVTWAHPMQGAILAAILSALLIGWIHLNYRQREDSVIATVWSVGMAIGVLFIAKTPGFNVELMSYLLGNILWVSHTDLLFLATLDLIVIIAALLWHKRFLIICFDEDQAALQGVHVSSLYLLLLSLTAISVVLLIQVVGIILALTMLTLPPTIAGLFKRRMSGIIMTAILLAACFQFGGLVLSYELDWPPGATVALLTAFCYLIALFCKRKAV